jgi:hypothetical protein
MIFRSTHFRPTEANGVPSEPSERRALRAIEERLLIDDEFVLRCEPDNSSDGLPPGEGLRSALSGGSSQGPHARSRVGRHLHRVMAIDGDPSGMERPTVVSRMSRAPFPACDGTGRDSSAFPDHQASGGAIA